MKKLISLFLLLAIATLTLASCGASDGDDEDEKMLGSAYSQGLAYRVSEDNPDECVITGIGSCTDKDIVIPSYIKGMRVVGIEEGAFSPKSALTAKTRYTATVTALGSKTEEEEDNAPGRVTLSVSSIADALVGGELVYQFEAAVADRGEDYETGTGTPIALEEIESVRIPLSVSDIGEEAFYGCEDLSAISAHAKLSAIGKDAFKETAYYNNRENWENKALYLGNYLLSVSGDASGEFTVKEGTTMIASYAFYRCEGITTVNLSSNMASVGSYAFYGCTNLTYVSPGSSSVSVGTGAFEGCTYYTYVGGMGDVFNGYQPIGPGGATPAPTEKYPTQFEEIHESVFEAVKKALPDHYTCEVRSGSTVSILKTNGVDYHYAVTDGGVLSKEYYATTDEGGIVTYRLLEDDLYRTNETLPTTPWIPGTVNLEDLTLVSAKGNLYCYHPDGDETKMVELGFKNKKLCYIGLFLPGETVEVYYYDVDTTVVPSIPLDKLIGDAVLDENGNKR